MKLGVVERLKKMTNNYPTSTVDFDQIFLYHLLREVFTTEEIVQCGVTSRIRHMKTAKTSFVKGCEEISFLYSDHNALKYQSNLFFRHFLEKSWIR